MCVNSTEVGRKFHLSFFKDALRAQSRHRLSCCCSLFREYRTLLCVLRSAKSLCPTPEKDPSKKFLRRTQRRKWEKHAKGRRTSLVAVMDGNYITFSFFLGLEMREKHWVEREEKEPERNEQRQEIFHLSNAPHTFRCFDYDFFDTFSLPSLSPLTHTLFSYHVRRVNAFSEQHTFSRENRMFSCKISSRPLRGGRMNLN